VPSLFGENKVKTKNDNGLVEVLLLRDQKALIYTIQSFFLAERIKVLHPSDLNVKFEAHLSSPLPFFEFHAAAEGSNLEIFL
jgi:hypothetical protein